MRKFGFTVLKVVVLLALIIPLAFASDLELPNTAVSEPLFLSLCGVILLVFGMTKSRSELSDSK